MQYQSYGKYDLENKLIGENYYLNYISEDLEIKKADDGKGRGIFATEDI